MQGNGGGSQKSKKTGGLPFETGRNNGGFEKREDVRFAFYAVVDLCRVFRFFFGRLFELFGSTYTR